MGNSASPNGKEEDPCEKFASEFLAAIESANPLSDPALSLPETQRLTQFGSSVFAFPLLPAALCRRLVRHLESLQTYYSFAIDPTGIVLDNEPALRRLFQTLAHRLFVPLLQRLAGPDAVLHVAYQHALCVRFDALGLAHAVDGECEGHGHPMHTDAADVTLNVCLSEHFAGGALVFHREDGSVEQVVERRQGDCVVHNGRRLHSANPIYFGTRYSLVVWFRYCPYFHLFPKLPQDLQLHILTLTDFPTARAFCCVDRKFDQAMNSADAVWLQLLPVIDPTGKYRTIVQQARKIEPRKQVESENLQMVHFQFTIPDLPAVRPDASESKRECFILERATQWRSYTEELEALRLSLVDIGELINEKCVAIEEYPRPRINPFASKKSMHELQKTTELDEEVTLVPYGAKSKSTVCSQQ